tara:strand:+ start:355 stop:474 length:120 start_codon:yes stop_codon:yes gene_type:complete
VFVTEEQVGGVLIKKGVVKVFVALVKSGANENTVFGMRE